MGVDLHTPLLPAPTDSSNISSAVGESQTATDLATDISRRTDRTSFSVPEDGSPITISTRKKRQDRAKDTGSTLTRGSHHSQTSLLIEYFEGGKGGTTIQSRPSVRVKVTPSAARKIKDTNDHIQISETTGKSRHPSYTKRISLGTRGVGDRHIIESGDDKSLSSYASATEESNLASRGPPVEVEVMHREHSSPALGTLRDAKYVQTNPSDISSMPPDSFLDGNPGTHTPERNRSRSMSRDELAMAKDSLKTPSRRRSRSLSRERITQKVIEKLGNKPRETSSKHHRSNKSRSGSLSKEQLAEAVKSPRRRSSRSHRDEELISGAESSLLSTSQFSPSRKSGDQYSFRSGTSKSSINNPKLLETVEDAIRRLILPELTALKNEQKTQQNRSKFEKGNRDSLISGSSIAEEDDNRRRIAKVSSAPDVAGKPKVVLNRDEHDPGIVLSGSSVKGRKDRNGDKTLDTASERSYGRGASEETVIRDEEKVHRKSSKDRHGWRDAAAGGIAGGILTAAALKHHDSKSSIDKRERRKKHSKSRSRSASIAESSEEVYHRHDVPAMPFSSDIHSSELTRDSILSERTEEPRSGMEHGIGTPVHEVARGSPREISSPSSRTPTRTPHALQKGFGTHHSNLSRGDLSIHSTHSDHSMRSPRSGEHQLTGFEAEVAGATLISGVGALAAEHHLEHHEQDAPLTYDFNHPDRRGLSPIQSVASYRDDISEPQNRDSFRHTHSAGSLSSLVHETHRKHSTLSINSLSSSPSTNFARSRRPQGINLEKGEIIDQDPLRDSELTYDEHLPRKAGMEHWYDQQHLENDKYRSSLDNDSYRDSTIDVRHMTNYTDDSLDAPHLDKVTQGQHVLGVGANPEYRHTPLAVESAVASLLDASVLESSRSARSKIDDRSYLNSPIGGHPEVADYTAGSEREYSRYERDDPVNEHHNTHSIGVRSLSERSLQQHSAANSLRHTTSRSMNEMEEHVSMGASGLPVADDPIPEIGHGLSDESDINTNPSIIQGPIGGVQHDSRDHWPYQPTPPQSNGNLLAEHGVLGDHHGLEAGEAGLLGGTVGAVLGAATGSHKRDLGQNRGEYSHQDDQGIARNYEKQPALGNDYEAVNHDFGPIRDSYMSGDSLNPTPPLKEVKDEGYISAAHPRSPGAYTPDPQAKGVQLFGDDGVAGINDVMAGDDDPFISQNHARHLSGYSHGMPSPLYDSSTGKGVDRIQSRDVVALMDHLTVRDAQRNARDTEILVTLVRSAAEMRNSFEDMKKFIKEQDKMIVETTDNNTERSVQKVLQGPRPQPLGTPRVPRRTSAEEEMIDDIPTKRKNVFRRALKGLSMRSSNDLAKIEDMLVQLLGEVEGLKAVHELRPSDTQHNSQPNSHPNSIGSYDNLRTVPEGYEPEGHAGTSSTENHSGYFSNPPSRQASAMRVYDGRRESNHRISTVQEDDEELSTPEQEIPGKQFPNNEQLLTPTRETTRGGSVPLDTPPQTYVPTGAHSNENTPRTEKNRKHKSNSSSIFPKISRWSGTTTSSIAKNFRNSGRKEKAHSEASRSGSDLNYYDDERYEPHPDDKLRSQYPPGDEPAQTENRSPSPLIPQDLQDDPKYQVHRNSLILEHPQPRPGPTHRYQHHLESQAQNFGSSLSPASEHWGSNPSLARFPPGTARAGNLSPISDGGYSQRSASQQSTGPPRPPKVPNEPLVPQRPPKIASKDGKPHYASPLSAGPLAPGEEQRFSDGSSGYSHANGSPRSASGRVPQRKPTGPRPFSSVNTNGVETSGTTRRHRSRDSADVTF
ncbi:MAG: hypothetical protein M1827_003681 [Pycnora praestabilis]|nr:MAG: hypothetical protein M1827_003681 [Pycnora praestabilis]